MDTIRAIFQSKAVLALLWSFIRACITAFFPTVPQTIMLAADALVVAIIAVVAVSDARIRVNAANARKLNDPE